MFNRIFYHSTLRKYIISFGSLFNDLTIRRYDNNEQAIQVLKVPIRYGPQEKWFALLKMPVEDRPIAIQLPRLSFHITSINYDPARKINTIHKNVAIYDADNDTVLSEFVPVPYKIGIDLVAYVKNADDGCQIMEQILPYFDPTFTQQLKLIPEMDLDYDVLYELMSVNFDDVFEGNFQERKVMILTFSFEIRVFFFGPVTKSGVIKRIQIDLIPVPGQGEVTADEIATHGRVSRIVVKPGLTANGTPTSNANLSIPYSQIDADDDYGFIEEFTEYHDGLKYNPVKGKDG